MNDIEQLIERYLSKDMTDFEIQNFEIRLQTDAEFASEYEKTLVAHQLITEAGRLHLKQKLGAFDDDIKTEITTTNVFPLWIKPIFRIAAILVISLGIYQFAFNQSITANEVYDDYFVVYNSPSVIRNSETNTKVNWQKASQLYQDRNYVEAIMFFNKAENEMPKHQIYFYKAMSYVSLNNPDYTKALQNFENVLLTDNDYKQQALWYKALILLKQNSKEKAFDILNNIVTNKNYNYKKAEAILELKIKN